MTPATDMAGPEQLPIEYPIVKTPEELDAHIEETYGSEVLHVLKDSTGDQAEIVRKLHESGQNGRSEAIERMYRLHQQEFDRKESFTGSAWETTKNVLSAPFRWAWQSFKEHPVLTSLAAAALAAGAVGVGFYLAGEWELLLSSVGLKKIVEAGGAASELAPMTPATPPLPGGGVFEVPPPVNPPVPGINTPT